MADITQALTAAKARLERQITRTRWSMIIECLAQAFWPTLSVILLGGALWGFGVLGVFPPQASLAFLGLFAVAVIGALMWGARTLVWPGRDDAVARLDSALPGRPIEALGDQIAIGQNDPGARALWARHLERMAERAAAARAARPNLQLAPRDPWGLRLMALVAALAAIVFAGRPEPIDLALTGTPSGPQIASGPSFEAWANPPAYTGRPTLYLTQDVDPELDLPVGTEVTIRVYGSNADHSVDETVSGSETQLENVAEGIGSASFRVEQDGSFALARGAEQLAQWSVTVIPDALPNIALEGDVERSTSGAMELSFRATDDYGVVRAEATIELDLQAVDRSFGLESAPDPREAIVLDLPMPLSGQLEDVSETLVEDLSKHPWAGLPVTISLLVEDAAAQFGR
ncbi:MAG: DUF4175 family protein, partial [Pseudomonadota bacterium]